MATQCILWSIHMEPRSRATLSLHPLDHLEFVIASFLLEQLLVRSQLRHAAVVNVNDDVRVLDGGQTVSDDDARATFLCAIQSFLDHLEWWTETCHYHSVCLCLLSGLRHVKSVELNTGRIRTLDTVSTLLANYL